MDRDLALELLETMDDIKTALETIATNTTPAEAAASVNDSRAEAAPEEEPELEPEQDPEPEPEQEPEPEPEPEPETRTTPRKK